MIILSVVSIAGAAPTTDNKTIVAILVVNNSGLEDSNYIVDTTIEHLKSKVQGSVILAGSELSDKLKSVGITDISTTDSSRLVNALKELGVTHIAKAEVNKVEIKRGIKMGLTIKKWCTADVPMTTTVTDIINDKFLYNKTVQEKGKNEVTLGFASSGGAVKTALTKIFEQVDIDKALLEVK